MFKGLIKLIVFILLVGVFVFNFTYALKSFYFSNKPAGEGRMLVQAPLRTVSWEDIGKVSDPVLDAKVKTIDGWEKTSFLLDSGAVISSLPREMADKMGLELAFLKRIAFVGFGNSESFAYQGEMTLAVQESELTLPVVFTESYGTRSILGRKGFFDEYVITFDKKRGVVEIKE